MECGGFMYWKKILSPCDVCFTSDHNLFLNALHCTGGFCLFEEKIEKNASFHTGKSLSEALILASTNPQYDKRLFIEFSSSVHENYKLRTLCCVLT